jgi:hypothetical protein
MKKIKQGNKQTIINKKNQIIIPIKKQNNKLETVSVTTERTS